MTHDLDTSGEGFDGVEDGADVDAHPPCDHLDTACSHGVFSAELSRCVLVAVDDDTVCDDGNACTSSDRCRVGQCHGTLKECPGTGPCEVAGTCDSQSGQCVVHHAVDGTSCVGTDRCALAHACDGGLCVPTELARDLNDWRVSVPPEIKVAHVFPSDPSFGADILGHTRNDVSLAPDVLVPTQSFVWLGTAGDHLAVRVVVPRRRAESLLESNLRPHRDATSKVTGFVSLASSNNVVAAEWYGPERILRGITDHETLTLTSTAPSLALPVVSDSNPYGFAYAMAATGCVSTPVFDPNLNPPQQNLSVCADNTENHGVYLVFVDLRNLAFSEAVLPMRWQSAVLGPNARGAVPTPRSIAIANDGAIALLVEFSGALVRGDGTLLLESRDGGGISNDWDVAVLTFSAVGQPLDVYRVSGARNETAAHVVWGEDRSISVLGFTESERVDVARGAQFLGTIPLSERESGHAGLFVTRFDPSGEAAWLHRLEIQDPVRPPPRPMALDHHPDLGTRIIVRTASRQRVFPELDGPALPALHLGFHALHFDSQDVLASARIVHETLDGETWYDAENPTLIASGFGSETPAEVVAIRGVWSGSNGFRLLDEPIDFTSNQNPPTHVLLFNSNDLMSCTHPWPPLP